MEWIFHLTEFAGCVKSALLGWGVVLEGKNMKISKIAISAATAAVLALAPVSRADETLATNPFLAALSTTTQAELPAKAADLVAKAGTKQQPQTTIDVVRAAVGLNPAAAAVIVGSIAQTTQTMAAIAAGTAVSLVPNQATAIARAAAAAAPQQAGKIVEAICRVLPVNYSEVAEAVADVVPGAGQEILIGISAAIPALKEPIDKVLLAQKGSVPSVSGVLGQVESTESVARIISVTAGAGPLLVPQPFFPTPPTSIRPPYVAPVVSPVDLNPGAGGTVPPGGRNYANP